MSDTLVIRKRFCGPPNSGNGGYSAGCLAALVDGAALVTLRKPPPLDTPMSVARDGRVVRAMHGDDVIAMAEPKPLELDVPAPPTREEAAEMSARYIGFDQHVFATCFTCGPKREEGDGLRLFAGPREHDGHHAAPWTPTASMAGEDRAVVQTPIVWAALDCPGYFAIAKPGELAVLGRIHGHATGPVRVDEPHIVTAWPIERDGRKLYAGTAIFRGDGTCVASAHQTWITITELPA